MKQNIRKISYTCVKYVCRYCRWDNYETSLLPRPDSKGKATVCPNCGKCVEEIK